MIDFNKEFDERGREIEKVPEYYIECKRRVKQRMDILFKHFNVTTALELNQALQDSARNDKGLKCKINGRIVTMWEVDKKGNVYFIKDFSEGGEPHFLEKPFIHNKLIKVKYIITSDVLKFIDEMAENKKE